MKTPLAVVFTVDATEQVREIKAWWLSNRRIAPDLFADELDGAIDVLAHTPTLGTPTADARLPGVKRLLLQQSRYHLYFRIASGRLEILAVWHAVRGSGPDG